ncbi:MAG: tRNA 4-thiouridine(8) synthase ThiI [Bacilli bacterium]|nr:tRNA 4-thiouridine(8) synthase ThiI [Bacilli bacterium]
MEKVIIIKYGELTTKKDNINFFIKMLRNNISIALTEYNYDLTYDKGRMFIRSADIDKCVLKLKNIFGIHDFAVGYTFKEKDFEIVCDNVLALVKEKDFKTFKVETKRSDKNYPLDSMQISRSVGACILKNKDNIKVDVSNPEVLINIEIRNNEVLVYFEKIKGLGGYPVGTLGKGLLMLSGGIDSPVAGYLAIKRGVKLEAIYFESPPHTSEDAKNKVLSLAKSLAEYNLDIKVHVINFTEIQETIYKKVPHEYLITIMRRMMYRISEKIAYRNKMHILVNGESIGQVASQTLTSMKAINEVIKMPVIRPVACFDKNEIIKIAKDINTYETSILPFEDCCTIFVPKHPVINPESHLCEEYEKLFDYESLINKCIKEHEVIKVTCKNENKYEDLL